MIENPYESPLAPSDRESVEPNGLFIKLTIVPTGLALASCAAFLLSFCSEKLCYRPGVPNDEAVLYAFLYGLALTQLVTLFFAKAKPTALMSLRFLRMVLRSLLITGVIWLAVAAVGSALVEPAFRLVPNAHWEQQWLQIALVLSSAATTLLVWHVRWHRAT